MGGWVLEVVKMACYVSFPVGLFHYFNSPGNIEENIDQTRIDFINKYVGVEQYEQKRQEWAEKKRLQLDAKKKLVDE